MLNKIKSFFSNLWRSFISFFMPKPAYSAPEFTAEEKHAFVVYLLKGQKGTSGFALRHVNSNRIKNANVLNGFQGDAISYSITPYLMSQALNQTITRCSWRFLNGGDISYMTNSMAQPALLDQDLAVRLFDCLHERILRFLGFNFADQPRHFMLIKNMRGALSPYDINNIYPTGKCGRQLVEPSQILEVYSKRDESESIEELAYDIENGMLQLANAAQNSPKQDSTEAILSVLREIKLNANDTLLTLSSVHRRLVEAELEDSWSDSRYHQFHDKGGYLQQFEESIADVNGHLAHFRALI